MTPVLFGAAAMCGAFAFTFTLWITGFGNSSSAATARLMGLRNGGAGLAREQTEANRVSLRKRAGVTMAGMNVVSANAAANWQRDLDRAGLTLTTKEYLILRTVLGMVFAVLLFIPFSGLPIIALAGFPIGFVGGAFWVKRRITARTKKLEAQMVEMLQMLASGLRAGFGLIQALEGSADQLPAPLSMELQRTLRDISVGASVEEALNALNVRVGSPDFDIVVTAILIQRAVGGNLAEILDSVAHTMRERERIRGEIQTLTSQQRMTGFVIGGIPVGLAIIFYIISPDFMSLLFTDPLGRMMLGGAIVMEFLGFMVIRKIVNIEV
jgi:tight adherence protein B